MRTIHQLDYHDSDISLLDIVLFLKGASRLIAITGLSGLAISVAYLFASPKKYEAFAQIAMAQISPARDNLNPLGINIEDPSLLVLRLSQPTSFPPQVLSSCGMDGGVNSGVVLSKSIQLAQRKGVVNVVELKTFGKSPDIASACAQAIFEFIKITQAQIVAPYIEEAKIKLADDEGRLVKAKDLVAKADKPGSAMGAAYLSTRDEIRFLLDEITDLQNLVTSNQSRATRLVAPIYVSDTPIGPKKPMVLLAGLFGGLLLGLLLALGSLMWLRFKSELQKQLRGVR